MPVSYLSYLVQKIFLLLRQELKELDIPGRTTIRNRVEKAYQDYMKQLEEDMAVWKSNCYIVKSLINLQKSVGKISLTTDAWSDPNQISFLAVTAHWIEAVDEKTSQGSKKL